MEEVIEGDDSEGGGSNSDSEPMVIREILNVEVDEEEPRKEKENILHLVSGCGTYLFVP